MHSSRELVVRLLQAAGTASIILAALYSVAPDLMIGNGIFVSALFVFLFAILVWRLAFNSVTGSLKLDEERVLFVGTGEIARKVARQILDQHEFAYRVIGFIDDDPSRIGERIVNPAIVGTPADIDRLIAEHRVDRIVVGLSDRRGKLPVEELLRAKMAGIRVEDATTTYERVTGKILIDDLRPSWLIFSDGFRVSRITRLMKRTIDLALSLMLAIVTLPLMLLTALLVLLEDGRPILYRQERVGENGRTFTSVEVPLHAQGRRKGRQADLGDRRGRSRHAGRPVHPQDPARRAAAAVECGARRHELRRSAPGAPVLRRAAVAEIPFYQQRHAVKPGLTGWAQVKYRYGSSLEDAMEKLRYDLYYIKHLSVIFDLTIVFDTVKVVLFRKGAA